MLEMRPPSMLILACGALAREILDLVRINRWEHVTLECLPAHLHSRPELIPVAVADRLDAVSGRYDRVFVGYADCGTGGLLDKALANRGVERLPGAHCYEFYASTEVFEELHSAEPGTFYLTDYLARHFDRLVWGHLGLDRHPELRDTYFGNYERLVYLSQRRSAALVAAAEAAADRLGLAFEHRSVGYGDLESTLLDSASVGR
jgi:hypothetical protein